MFLFWLCVFQPFCLLLLCWFCVWCFLGFVLCFVFVFFFVLVSVNDKKTVFPAILVFLVMLVNRVV